MLQFVKRHNDFFLLSLIATVFYALMIFVIGIDISEEVMYSTVDGNSYREVAHWIETGEYTPYIGVRPYLYPFLVFIGDFIGGFRGVWMLQFMMWLLTVNFLYGAINRLTGRKYLAYIGTGIFIVNLSLISLTFHALSEVTTTFLLSIILLLIAMNKNKLTAIRFIHCSLFLLGLLTVVRPMFLYPFMGVLIVLPFVKFRTYIKSPINVLWLGFVLLPVVLQMGILKWNYDEFGISMRSSDTVDFYLMAQCMEQDKGIDITAARAIIIEMSTEERHEYKVNHLGLMGSNLITNIEGNIKGDSFMLIHLPEVENTGLRKLMTNMNIGFFHIHKFFFLALLVLTVFLFRKRNWTDLLLIWSLVALPLYYIVTSGVSFSQGDRLVVPALALWIPAYILIGTKLVEVGRYYFNRGERNS